MAKKDIKEIGDIPGVGETTAEKLKEGGLTSLEAIAVASPGEIMDSAGLGEATARKIINAARTSLKMGFETADKIYNIYRDVGIE